jgi:hypothetical protein
MPPQRFARSQDKADLARPSPLGPSWTHDRRSARQSRQSRPLRVTQNSEAINFPNIYSVTGPCAACSVHAGGAACFPIQPVFPASSAGRAATTRGDDRGQFLHNSWIVIISGPPRSMFTVMMSPSVGGASPNRHHPICVGGNDAVFQGPRRSTRYFKTIDAANAASIPYSG